MSSSECSQPPVCMRAIRIDFLLNFTSEHNLWHKPTFEVVKDIISPLTASKQCPYTALLDEDVVGKVELFISHAWLNPFGLLVAAARKFISDSKLKGRIYRFIWLDVFAMTQHSGSFQAGELGQIEETVSVADSTLVVLDVAHFAPLRHIYRIWCIFEIYCSLRCGVYGKLKVRVGDILEGEFIPCTNGELLRLIAESIQIQDAEATVFSDKDAILNRVRDMCREDRNGTDEVNRKLRRAVRQGWV
jgi:hypothetical protein